MPEIISRDDAKAAGLKKYFTGNLCKHGHISERILSSNNCLLCLNRYGRLSYKKNHEKILKDRKTNENRKKSDKERKKKNREKLLEIARRAEIKAAVFRLQIYLARDETERDRQAEEFIARLEAGGG